MNKLRSVFSYESRLWELLSFLGELVMLSLFWLFTSIPLITIGTSTSTLYKMMLRKIRNGSFGPLTDYFRIFAKSFLQTTAIWLIYVVVITWLLVGTAVFWSMQSLQMCILAIVELAGLVTILPGMNIALIWQHNCLLAPARIVWESTKVGLKNLPKAFAVLLLQTVTLQIVLWFPALLPFFLMFGTGFIAYGVMHILNEILRCD